MQYLWPPSYPLSGLPTRLFLLNLLKPVADGVVVNSTSISLGNTSLVSRLLCDVKLRDKPASRKKNSSHVQDSRRSSRISARCLSAQPVSAQMLSSVEEDAKHSSPPACDSFPPSFSVELPHVDKLPCTWFLIILLSARVSGLMFLRVLSLIVRRSTVAAQICTWLMSCWFFLGHCPLRAVNFVCVSHFGRCLARSSLLLLTFGSQLRCLEADAIK